MPKDVFEERRRSFEEEYFQRKDAQLVEKLKAVFHKSADRESLRAATKITDEQVLDRLVALDLSGELMAAFNLFPLVEIAWADGACDERERQAILAAVARSGIAPGSGAYAMLENALAVGPRPDGRTAWYAYAAELKKVLGADELATFRQDLLANARTIAESSGGLLDMAFKVSGSERRVLDAIERALT